MRFVIRPATVDDAYPLARLHVATWQSAYAEIVPDDALEALDVDQWAQRKERQLSEPGQFTTLLAETLPETDAEIAGFTTFGPYREGSGTVDLTVGEIVAIYVHLAHQGLGFGHALMDAAVRALADRGVGEIRLWVLEKNWPSRRFYERYGLAADGQRDTFRMQRPSGESVDLPEVRYVLRVGGGG
jgi:ribosomal protein S18 acetylase RimI-like enzyme